MKVRPVLGDWLIPRVSSIKTLERRASGDTLPARIVITGSLYGDELRDSFLEKIRAKYRSGEPVIFMADIVNAAEIRYVTIDTLVFQESGARPDQTDYLIALRQGPPRKPASDPIADIEKEMNRQAQEFVESIARARSETVS